MTAPFEPLIRSTEELAPYILPFAKAPAAAKDALALMRPYLARAQTLDFPLEPRSGLLDTQLTEALVAYLGIKRRVTVNACSVCSTGFVSSGFAFEKRPFLWRRLGEWRNRYKAADGTELKAMGDLSQVADLLRMRLESAMMSAGIPPVAIMTVDEAVRAFLMTLAFGSGTDISRMEGLLQVMPNAIPLYQAGRDSKTWAVYYKR